MTQSPDSTKTPAVEALVNEPRDGDLRLSEVELALELLVDVEATHDWLRPNDLCCDARRKDWCRDARMKEVKANLQHISELCRDGEAYRAERQSGAPPSPPPNGPRRQPSIAKLIERAEKTGKTVTSITTSDGTRIGFGEPEKSQDNPLDQWLAKKHARAPERH